MSLKKCILIANQILKGEIEFLQKKKIRRRNRVKGPTR